MSIAATNEQLALQGAIRDWAKRTGTLHLVRAQEQRFPDSASPSNRPRPTSRPTPTDLPGGKPGTGPAAAPATTEPNSTGSVATDQRYWEELAALGVFAISLPEEAGGAGGTVGDLAAALEELTLTLAPGPVLPSVLAGLALAPAAGNADTREFLTSLAAGSATATVAAPDGWPAQPTTGGSTSRSSVIAE